MILEHTNYVDVTGGPDAPHPCCSRLRRQTDNIWYMLLYHKKAEASPVRRCSVCDGKSLEALETLEYVCGGYSTNYESTTAFSLAGPEIR